MERRRSLLLNACQRPHMRVLCIMQISGGQRDFWLRLGRNRQGTHAEESQSVQLMVCVLFLSLVRTRYDVGFIDIFLDAEIKTRDGANGAFSRRIPDLTTKVHAHSSNDPANDDDDGSDKNLIHAIVFEVGFTQRLASLQSRARMWLENKDTGTHLVV